MGALSPLHWLVVLLVVLLLFGGSKLADIGKGLGEGIKNFKKGLREADEDDSKPLASKKIEVKAAEEKEKS